MGSRFPNRCQNPGNEIPNILVHEVYVIDITPSALAGSLLIELAGAPAHESLDPVVKATLLVFCFALAMPKPAHAIPAFARKYGVKCYACHTIPPALNKNGYMFKRLGYRMPPDEMDGTKPAPKITELDKDIKFNLTNALALVLQGSFTAEKTVADPGNTTSASPVSSCNGGTAGTQQSSSCTSFNLDEAALFVAGAIPIPASPTSATMSCIRGATTIWSKDSAFTRRPCQQQLLH